MKLLNVGNGKTRKELAKKRFSMTPGFMHKYVLIFREKGLTGGLKAVGWPTAIGLFLFFLIKGMTLYIILPYMIAKGFFAG